MPNPEPGQRLLVHQQIPVTEAIVAMTAVIRLVGGTRGEYEGGREHSLVIFA
jgi:hypothetical protein